MITWDDKKWKEERMVHQNIRIEGDDQKVEWRRLNDNYFNYRGGNMGTFNLNKMKGIE